MPEPFSSGPPPGPTAPSRPARPPGDFPGRHPILLFVLVYAGTYATARAAGFLADLLAAQVPALERYREAGQPASLVALVGMSLVPTVVLLWLGWWRDAGFGPPRTWRSLHLLWLPALYAVAQFVVEPPRDLSAVGLIAFRVPENLLVGFFEEALCRAVLLYALLRIWQDRRGGAFAAALVSSLVFGVMHLQNWLIGEQPLAGTLVQITFATSLGIGFAGVLLRTNALWPLVLIHGLIDVAANAFDGWPTGSGAEGGPTAVAVLYFLPVAVYGLVLMRPSQWGKLKRAEL